MFHWFRQSSSAFGPLDRINVVADININPHLKSSAKALKTCMKVLRSKGLNPKAHAFGTNIEGRWSDISEALRECHRLLHSQGIKKISSNLHISSRVDRKESLAKRLAAV
jgi:uncharacterized protein (TIGR00106 family)